MRGGGGANGRGPSVPSGSGSWSIRSVLVALALSWLLALALIGWSLDVRLVGGPYDASTLGTVGDWASGIGTALAVVGAFLIFNRQTGQTAELLHTSHQELSLALIQLQLQQQEQQRRQAESVSAWLSCANTVVALGLARPDELQAIADWNARAAARGWKRSRSSPPEWSHDELGTSTLDDWATTDTPFPMHWFPAVMILNASNQPIYDFRVVVSEARHGVKVEVWHYEQKTLPPASTPVPLRVATEGSPDTFLTESEARDVVATLAVAATFRDSGGRAWLRREDGILQERDSETR